MKIGFFGSDKIAAITLEYMHKQGINIVKVITKENKKQGRGMQLKTSVVQKIAKKLQIPVCCLDNCQDSTVLKSCSFLVVVNYGKILPKNILNLPQICCLNIHFSLLPKWRGAAPVRYCLKHGDQFSGVTIMKMVEKLDAGDILAQRKISITPKMNCETLTSELVLLGCRELCRVLENYSKIKPIAQKEALATYSYKIKKEDALVYWDNPAQNIYWLYQALSPKPAIFSYWKKKKIFLKKISLLSTKKKYQNAGEIIGKQNTSLEVSTLRGSLLLEEVQMDNKKQLLAKDWYNGYHVQIGEKLG